MDISYAQNLEDYHLARLFEGQASGFYVDVGAGHPVGDNVSFNAYLRGWSGIVVVAPLSELLPSITLWLIVIGGVIYSLGVIFHVWERLRFQNAIWHGFVISAAMVHYSAVLTCFSLTPASA